MVTFSTVYMFEINDTRSFKNPKLGLNNNNRFEMVFEVYTVFAVVYEGDESYIFSVAYLFYDQL